MFFLFGAGKKPIGAPSSGAGAIKPVKIPPYDFKARFHALNEKHTALKDKCSSLEGQLGELKDLPEKYTETVRIVAENAATIANLTRDCERATKAKAECEADQRNLLQSLKQANADLTSAKDELETLRLSFSKTTKECEYLEAKNKIFSSENETLKTELKQIRDILYNSNVERKELHNQMMDLRGNIRVFCRVRPPLPSEEDRLLCNISHIDESSLEVSSIDEMPSGARVKATKHEFNFDHIFHQYSEQDDVFQSVSPLIQSALDGYNVCIFAYGQTGSGKTYTMDGTSTDIGIIPRTVDLLFDCVQRYKLQGWEYSIKVTFLEIYNEILYDLLSNEAKDLEIRMVSAKTPTEIFVSNITEETVESASRLRQLMAIAKSNRATASTVGNERSSRSHAVTRLQMHGYHNKKNEICVGTINLVDLAGSECPKNSVRMDETKKINRSLSELTNVIMALVQKNEHVPYRNSKLTHLLMPCLGGNSKTLMIVNVSPFQECFNETTKSLRFASTVKSCKMNKSKKNRFLAIE